MDNIVLDVAIGLIFIFVLYSLLATTINEFVATIFSYRQRMLDTSLEQMLDGKKISYYWWDKLANIIIWVWYIFFPPKEKKQSSKISEEYKLPDFFSKKTLDKNTVTSAKGTVEVKYKRVALNKKAQLFAAEITSHPLYLRAAENSVLNKKPAYLPAATFSDILIDVLKPDANVITLLKDIKAGIANHPLLNDDTKKILGIYLEQANGDLLRFKLLVEDWYNETQKRVSGWYKRQSYWVLLIIGIFMAFAFNVNTIEIIKKLSNNPEMARDWANSAATFAKENPGLSAEQKEETAVQRFKKADTAYTRYIDDATSLLGLGWGDYGYSNKLKEDSLFRNRDSLYLQGFANNAIRVPRQQDTLIKNGGKIVFLLSEKSLGRTVIRAYLNKKFAALPEKPGFIERVWYIIKSAGSSPRALVGFIITALAISLGAPFWFDLLNKFVNLRVSGKKPEDGTATTPASKTAGLNQHPSPQLKSFG